jgi:hypothetical protein
MKFVLWRLISQKYIFVMRIGKSTVEYGQPKICAKATSGPAESKLAACNLSATSLHGSFRKNRLGSSHFSEYST